jgi:hypothetical protein
MPSSKNRDGASSVKQTIFLSLLKVTARLETSARTCVLNLVAGVICTGLTVFTTGCCCVASKTRND